ncbi:hypothetical protein [Mesorhizobium sp.]|uniref:hypothetical protein n=1 Tax=Mesorhizobium sp. TaxID=1871066 RepID=UPI0025C23D3A|nr:hypothetical protein [Mesorhizobium sp.]
MAELNGDLTAFWNRIARTGRTSPNGAAPATFAFAPTGPGVADFVQLSLGRECEVLAGPAV